MDLRPLWVVLGLLAMVAVAVLYVRAVQWVYRLRDTRPRLLCVATRDGGRLAVYHRAAQPARRYLEPVLLCHGLAANHLNMDFDPPYSLAHAVAAAGFECFSVDWRGAGPLSRPPKSRHRFAYTVDDLIRDDGPTLLMTALKEAGAPSAFWLGHSMGALVGYGVAQGEDGARLKGILALGAPVSFVYEPWLRAVLQGSALFSWPWALRQRLLSTVWAPVLGSLTLPLSETVIQPKSIPPHILRKLHVQVVESVGHRLARQFKDWVLNDAFRSEDGRTDYRAGLARLTLPALVMGGSEDRLARPEAILRQYDLLGSADKTMMIFGRDNGDQRHYGHGDLLFGELAPLEVYPRIVRWLEAHATPIPS